MGSGGLNYAQDTFEVAGGLIRGLLARRPKVQTGWPGQAAEEELTP